MTTNWDTEVKVPLWAVLWAIRYGLGRRTYANGDAAALAKEFWERFDVGIRTQIRDDAARLTGLEAEEWRWLTHVR
jgi:hypothetical protein